MAPEEPIHPRDPDAGLEASLEQALSSAEEEALAAAGEVRPFDFLQPQKLSRTFEHTLRNLCENFAKTAAISLTNLFRVNTSFEFAGQELLPGSEFLASLPAPTCIATFKLAPLKGNSALQVDLSTCFSMMKKLMGGSADPEETVREFTEIERHILTSILQRLLDNFKEAGARLLDFEAAVEAIENNPEFLSGLPTGDSFVALTFELKVDTAEGKVKFGLPLGSFEPVLDVFDPEETRELRSAAELRADRSLILGMLQGTETEIVVKLGEIDMGLEEILRLAEGDLLQLAQPADGLLPVEIEGKRVFLGEAGRVNQSRAIKLNERLSEE